MDKYYEPLALIGLNEQEARIYVASLSGPLTVNAIAKKSKVQRTHAYEIIDTLCGRGILLQTPKHGIKTFIAVNPAILLETHEHELKKLHTLLPRLKALQNVSDAKPTITHYEGKQGIDLLNKETLSATNEIVGFASNRFTITMSMYTGQEYIEKRVKKGIRVRAVADRTPDFEALQLLDKKQLRETRLLPKGTLANACEIGVFDSKTFIADYANEFGILIDNRQIAASVKNIFEVIWKKWE